MPTSNAANSLSDLQIKDMPIACMINTETLTWRIADFGGKLIARKNIDSQTFSAFHTSWKLHLLIAADNGPPVVKGSAGATNLRLRNVAGLTLTRSPANTVMAAFDAWVVDGVGNQVRPPSLAEPTLMQVYNRRTVLAINDFLPLKLTAGVSRTASDMLRDGTLTICCRIRQAGMMDANCDCDNEEVEDNGSDVGDVAVAVAAQKTAGDIQVDSMSRSVYPDVTLVASDGVTEFTAHRVVLSAWSAVFSCMFSYRGTMEDVQRRVIIKDLKPETVEALLKFVYGETRKVDDSTNNGNAKISHELAEDLLVAADKYDMPRLRRHCEELLTDGLTADNVAETLIFADCYSFHRLRSAAADFLLKNFHQVETTDGWCQLVETCPPLANQLSHSRSTKRQADSNGVEVASENSTKRARLN